MPDKGALPFAGANGQAPLSHSPELQIGATLQLAPDPADAGRPGSAESGQPAVGKRPYGVNADPVVLDAVKKARPRERA